SEALSWTHGVHAFKFGGEFRHEGMNLIYPDNTGGSYMFNKQFTGNNFADFLLGYVVTVGRKAGNSVEHERGNFSSFFFQDDWKPIRTLTVNYGLRYDIQFPLHELNHLWNRWNFATGKLEKLGVDTPSPAAWETDWKDWGPRLGLAWDTTGKGRT